MSDINELRNQMDEITLDLVRLLKKRTDIARKIGEVKAAIGKNITDESREKNLRYKVIELSKQIELDEKLASKFLNFLLNESIKVQGASAKQTHLSIFLKAKEMEQKGKKIIHMEVGEPDFMPPEIVRDAMQEAYEKGFIKYGQAKGHVLLRNAISQKISKQHNISIDIENIIVTPGARFSIFLAITTLLDVGNEIIIIEPAWPAYRDCALNAGIKVRTVKTKIENKWEPTIEEIKELINSNTKMIVLNYPNNPTGKVLPKYLQDEIIEVARKNNLYVLSDEIYSQYTRRSWKSILEYNYDKAIVTQSFSKSHAMTGFRIGYTVTDKKIIERNDEITGIMFNQCFRTHAVCSIKGSRNRHFKKYKNYQL